jgi:sugar lactone lactonase YvrE
MHSRFLTSAPDSQSGQRKTTNWLMKNNYLITTGLSSFPFIPFPTGNSIDRSERKRFSWLLCLLFTCQTLISLGQTGTTVAGGHGAGGNADQLSNPTGVYVTANGVVYVADYDNHRVQRWDVGATSGVTVAGGNGSGVSGTQLNHPFGIFVDGSGAVYIADAGNHRIQKWAAGATSGVTVAGGNGSGVMGTQLSSPTGIYVAGDGSFYVADFLNNRVQKFPPNSTSATPGQTVAGGHGEGSAPNQLRHPEGVVVDESNGAVYVADTYNNRVQKWAAGAGSGETVAGAIPSGTDDSHLSTAFALYRDSNGDIYIADGYNHRIQKWASGATSGVTVAGGHGVGGNADQLNTPEGVFLDDNKRIYVADHANHRIQRFGSCLSPIATLSNSGTITCTNTSVLLTAGGGSAGNIYTFSNGASQIGGSTGNTATVTQGGSYSVTVTNTANGCTSTTVTQVASNTVAPNVSLSNTGPITDNNQTVTLTAGGGDTYVFSTSATQQNAPSGNTATTTNPGLYSVTATTTSNGCSTSTSTLVTGAVSQSACRNGVAVIKLVASGNPVKYEWYRNNINSARLTENPAQVRGTSTSSLTLVNQQVTATYYVRVTDADGSAIVYGPFKMTVNLNCNVYARVGTEEVELKISLLGNPISGDQLRATIVGAADKALTVQLMDLSGKPVYQQQWSRADSEQQIEWNLGSQTSGVYIMQAVTDANGSGPAQRHSLKVVKP